MGKETGGPAFPFVSNGGISDHQYCSPGMTLRDHFAAKAMQGFLSSGTPFSIGPSHKDVMEGAAVSFYLMADAMLKARGE